MLHYLNEQLARAPMAMGGRVLIENVSRRAFLKGTASGVGLVVAMQLLPFRTAGAFEPYHTGGLDMPNGIITNPLVFVSIDPDGTVTIVAHRSEMGTGSRTSVPMVLADEMEADWARVKIVQAPGDEPKYGNQDTDGSRSMRHHIQPMRQMGAAVRSMLEQAAAQKWGVDRELCRANNHEVFLLEKVGEGMAETDQRLGYGELAAAAMALPVPPFEQLTFKDESRLPLHRQGRGADLRPARHHHGQGDLRRRRPPARAEVRGDRAAAGGRRQGQVGGQRGGARGAWGREGDRDPEQHAAGEVRAARRRRRGRQQHVGRSPGPRRAEDRVGRRPARRLQHRAVPQGDVGDGRAARQGDPQPGRRRCGVRRSAAKVVSAEYYQPHMAHISMEPPVALVNVADGKVEIWGPVQSPWGTREDVAKSSACRSRT